jgi:hypothetical protein
MSIHNRLVLSLLCNALILLSLQSKAQETASIKKTEPYYIDVNKAEKGLIYEVQPDALCLQYYDAYGKADAVLLNIYDWKKTLVTKLSLDKTYGLNHFTIKLNEISQALKIGDNYTCQLVNEQGKKYEVNLKLISPPTKPIPEVDIFVNPLQLDCKGTNGSLVEFYGQISGGKAPYSTDWFVLNSGMNDFLYQPRSEEIAKAGNSMVIDVDKTPDYYVLFRVKDACGGVKQKMVHIVCEQEQNKINTVFVEPITITTPSKTK